MRRNYLSSLKGNVKNANETIDSLYPFETTANEMSDHTRYNQN